MLLLLTGEPHVSSDFCALKRGMHGSSCCAARSEMTVDEMVCPSTPHTAMASLRQALASWYPANTLTW